MSSPRARVSAPFAGMRGQSGRGERWRGGQRLPGCSAEEWGRRGSPSSRGVPADGYLERGGPGEREQNRSLRGHGLRMLPATFDISGGSRLQEHRVHLHAHTHTRSCLSARFIAHLGARVFPSGTNAFFLLLFLYFEQRWVRSTSVTTVRRIIRSFA